jgi:hypothetical protein
MCVAAGAGACAPGTVDIDLGGFERVELALIDFSVDSESDRFRMGAVFVPPERDGSAPCVALPEDVRATIDDVPLGIYRGAGYGPYLSVGTPNSNDRLEPYVADGDCFDPFVSLPTDYTPPADDGNAVLIVEAGGQEIVFEFARARSWFELNPEFAFDDLNVVAGAPASIPLPIGFDYDGSLSIQIDTYAVSGGSVEAGAVQVPMPQEPGRYAVNVAAGAAETVVRCEGPLACEVEGGSVLLKGVVIVDPG